MTPFASVVLLHRSLVHHDRVFTYSIPEGLSAPVGALVRVPFGRSRTTGVVTELLPEADVDRVVPIERTLGPGLDPETVTLCRWVSESYLSTMGEALAAAMPARVAAEEERTRPTPRDSYRRTGGPILRLVASHGHAGFSLRPPPTHERGRIIADLAAAELAAGRGTLILLPEVRVQTGISEAIAEALGDQVAWLGSDRSERERYGAWLDLRDGRRAIACGGRAAVFAPVPNCGLVIVDDEAHVSYKERRAPRFHARTVAAERARRAGARLVVVGVPPSIEVQAAVASGRMQAVIPAAGKRPPVQVVDLAAEPERLMPAGRTVAAGKAALARGERVLILSHKGGEEPARIMDRAHRTAGARRPARVDARTPEPDLRRALRDADLIVATAVVAKDLPIDHLGLLAICHADAALSHTGFRTSEEAFATWWRLAHEASAVTIETAQPEHPAVRALVRFDPLVLADEEMRSRKELGYPPFGALARVTAPAAEAPALAKEVESAGGTVIGPVERGATATFAVKAGTRRELVEILAPLAAQWRAAALSARIDVDPREVLS